MRNGVLFLNLLQMSVAGGVLILAVVLIRAIAINRLPKRFFLLFWGIAVFRLIIPFSPASPFSIYNVRQLGENSVFRCLEREERPREEGEVWEGETAWEEGPREETAVWAGDMPEKAAGKTNITGMAEIIWGMGCCVCFLFFAGAYLNCRKIFAVSVPVENEYAARWQEGHRLRRKIRIRQSDRIQTPLTYGLFHPVILVSEDTDWNQGQQMAFVLEHEFIHIKRWDILSKSLMIAVLSIHWFNPLVWVMYILFNRDLELSCDEAVVYGFGIRGRADYARALISMEELKSGLMPLCNHFGRSAVEERIGAIMKTKKRTFGKAAAGAAVLLCLFLFLGTRGVNRDEAAYTREQVNILGEETVVYSEEDDVSPGGGQAAYRQEKTDHSLLPETVAGGNEAVYETGDDAKDHGNRAYQVAKSEYFTQYKKWGISYDSRKGYLVYDGHNIGYFKDELSESHFIRYVDETGEVGVEINRDKNREITGITDFPLSEVVYGDQVAEETAELNAEAAVAAEATYVNDKEETPVNEEYKNNGVEWDKDKSIWVYQGEPVAVLYDQGSIYTYDLGKVYLEVVRGPWGGIQKIRRMTKEETEQLFR